MWALGQGNLRRLGAAAKAWRLDHALALGLPVPQGWVVSDEARRRLRDEGTLSGSDAAPEWGDAELFVQRLQWRLAPIRLAVRSAFGAEDDVEQSRAGAFRTELGVEGWRAQAVAAALCRVWASGAEDWAAAPALRRDVLLMEMVDAQVAGVAFTSTDGAPHRVEWGRGLADKRVSGEGPSEILDLDLDLGRDGGGGAPWAARLRALLAKVVAVFGDTRPWDVEWADDGRTCWLLQVRPVTGVLLRDDWFTVANHKEILPELPSHLMASVMEERAGELFGFYRAIDAGLPADRPFLELFAGRPRINLSLLCDMMARWGLPTRLVTDSIGGDGPPAAPLRPLRMLRRTPALLRMAWAQCRAVPRARRSIRRWRAERVDWADLELEAAVDRLGRLYTELVHGMFGLTAAMAPALSALRRAGVLAAHGGRHRTLTTRMYDSLGKVAAAPPERRDEAWAEFVAEFGHRGPFESDIVRPRFADARGAPGGADRAGVLPAPGPANPAADSRSWGQRLTEWATAPIWWWARGPMDARETLRDEAMAGFFQLRTALLVGAERAVAQGLLPDVDAIWDLTAEEVRALGKGRGVGPAAWEARRALRAAWAGTPLRDLFRRSGERAAASTSPGGEADRWQGMGLTRGQVHGVAWVARSALDAPPPRGRHPIILVAPVVEAGWIPSVLAADAVVVEMGGELSHGSILLREVGKPAVTGARGVHTQVSTGDELVVDGGSGLVVRCAARTEPVGKDAG